MPRVLLVDDHPVVRLGVRVMLERDGTIEVCAEAGNPAEALQMVDGERPDLMVVDLQLGGRGGIDLLADCCRRLPSLRVLVLSQHDEALYAERALKAGARGYLMKGERIEGIVEALHALMRGEIVLSKAMTARLLVRSLNPAPSDPLGALSNREMQIFLLIGAGRTTGQIADELSLSPKTISAHRENIKIKLDLSSGAELERAAMLHVEKL